MTNIFAVDEFNFYCLFCLRNIAALCVSTPLLSEESGPWASQG